MGTVSLVSGRWKVAYRNLGLAHLVDPVGALLLQTLDRTLLDHQSIQRAADPRRVVRVPGSEMEELA